MIFETSCLTWQWSKVLENVYPSRIVAGSAGAEISWVTHGKRMNSWDSCSTLLGGPVYDE